MLTSLCDVAVLLGVSLTCLILKLLDRKEVVFHFSGYETSSESSASSGHVHSCSGPRRGHRRQLLCSLPFGPCLFLGVLCPSCFLTWFCL